MTFRSQMSDPPSDEFAVAKDQRSDVKKSDITMP
jgi:hypothetical protein